MSGKKTASAKMPNFVGRIVDGGKYQLVKELGTGAYGVVYKAVSLMPATSSMEFAIKIMCKSAMNKRHSRHVRREIALHRVMSDHPNVVTMHTAFEDDHYIYIVLDFCPGGDLFGKVCDEKIYYGNDKLVKKVFLKLLDAVHACHRKRIFHRDLKPENILVNEDGSDVFLADFGLSTTNQASETFGCGSSYYMSPECIGKEIGFLPYSNRANDIWALGVILVNMVSCRSPWSKAVTMDDCFSEFLMYDTYLREMLPISEGANNIFRRIFTFDYTERITIPDLRKEILALDTFFMSEKEIARAPNAVRIAASYCGHKVAAVDTFGAQQPFRAGEEPNPRPAPIAEPIATTDAFVIGSASASVDGGSSETSSSGSESDGPVTPATHAQDPEIALPDIEALKLDDEIVEVRRSVDGKNRTNHNQADNTQFVAIAL